MFFKETASRETVTIETEVDKERRDLVRARLRDADMAASPVLRALHGTPAEREVPLHVWAVDDAGALVGGLVGHTWTTWLHTACLWVDEPRRGQGLGSLLLSRAELQACERGCTRSRVETWDFQAPDFYRKNGYDVVCEIPEYPPGATEFTLTKSLSSGT